MSSWRHPPGTSRRDCRLGAIVTATRTACAGRGAARSGAGDREMRAASRQRLHHNRRWNLVPFAPSAAQQRPPPPSLALGRLRSGEMDMDLDIKGKLALVSGSTAGIGLAIATSLALEGARVIINGRSQAAVDKAATTLKSKSGGDVRGFAGDLSSAASAEQLAREFPGVQILVNNLGIFEPKPFEQIPDADWLRFFDVNVLSGVRLARLYLPAMKRANWGRIIFISSESGIQIPAEMIHYGVTKTAQIAVARGLAEAVAGSGITVNSVLPGPTKSRVSANLSMPWPSRAASRWQKFRLSS